jgi:hypothetical protein
VAAVRAASSSSPAKTDARRSAALSCQSPLVRRNEALPRRTRADGEFMDDAMARRRRAVAMQGKRSPMVQEARSADAGAA